MADWFTSGVNAMSKGLGARSKNSFSGSSPFDAAPAQSPFDPAIAKARGNPFDPQFNSASGNPFGQGMPWSKGFSGYGTYTSDNPIAIFTARAMQQDAELQAKWGAQSFGGGQSMGQAAATGAWFAAGLMDGTEGEINAASAKYGVPANLIKSIIARESSGDWNRDGSRYVYLDSRGQHILPYSGILESTAKAWGYDPRQLIGNRAMQIDAVANGLGRLYSQVGGQYGWDGVINTYYSGDPSGGYTPGDSYQYGTTAQYLNDIKTWWGQLDQASGVTGYSQTPGGGGGGAYAMAWGGANVPITQEHGYTQFAADVIAGKYPGLAGMYDYAASVGVQGHPGIDVGVSRGTSLYTPASGTVVIAGGSGFYRDAHGDGPGRGELRIQMDNGDILIMGHMASISLVPGQRIAAGAYVGNSGTYNGDHLHYEVRRSTPGATSSGWTAVDPRTYFNGGGMAVQQGGSPGFPGQTPNNGLWWNRSMSSLFRR